MSVFLPRAITLVAVSEDGPVYVPTMIPTPSDAVETAVTLRTSAAEPVALLKSPTRSA